MNELIPQSQQLPDTIEDLSKFVIVGREKLKAVKAAISAIQKVGLAKEVYQQKLAEAQELAEVVAESEAKLGMLLKEIPKATKGTGTNQYQKKNAEISHVSDFSKKAKSREISHVSDFSTSSKQESVQNLGISQRQSEDFQRMADNPDALERAKKKAREENRVLSHRDVMEQIKFDKQLDVIERSGNDDIKTAVRSGDLSINQAYNAVRGIPETPKSPQKAMKELKKEIKERHDSFKEAKTVSVEEAKQDKEDKVFLSNDLYKKCLRIGAVLEEILIARDVGDVNLTEMAKTISANERQALLSHIARTETGLKKIKELLLQNESKDRNFNSN